jgi:hypothetical protein
MSATKAGAEALARHMTEDQLLRSVLDLAATYGWMAHHCRPARLTNGRWATPIQGNAGFPDLVLAHPSGRLIVAELKSQSAQTTTGQRQWLTTIAAAGVHVHVWRPVDWLAGDIQRALAERPEVTG